MRLAKQAERDLNSEELRKGKRSHGSDSTRESGIDESVTSRFPGAHVTYGPGASGSGDNRAIMLEEGGGLDPQTGRQLKARDFEGLGGPEDKKLRDQRQRGGDSDVLGQTMRDFEKH